MGPFRWLVRFSPDFCSFPPLVCFEQISLCPPFYALTLEKTVQPFFSFLFTVTSHPSTTGFLPFPSLVGRTSFCRIPEGELLRCFPSFLTVHSVWLFFLFWFFWFLSLDHPSSLDPPWQIPTNRGMQFSIRSWPPCRMFLGNQQVWPLLGLVVPKCPQPFPKIQPLPPSISISTPLFPVVDFCSACLGSKFWFSLSNCKFFPPPLFQRSKRVYFLFNCFLRRRPSRSFVHCGVVVAKTQLSPGFYTDL